MVSSLWPLHRYAMLIHKFISSVPISVALWITQNEYDLQMFFFSSQLNENNFFSVQQKKNNRETHNESKNYKETKKKIEAQL